MLNKLSACLLALGLLLGASGNAHAAPLTETQVKNALVPCHEYLIYMGGIGGPAPTRECIDSFRALSKLAQLANLSSDTQTIYDVADTQNFQGTPMLGLPARATPTWPINLDPVVFLAWDVAAGCIMEDVLADETCPSDIE